MLYHIHASHQPHQPQPPGGRQLCPTPEQLHRLDRIWVQLCAAAMAGPIPMDLDNTVTTYASIEGSVARLRVHPDLALLPEPAQRWELGHQLGHHARYLIDEHTRLRHYLTRAAGFVLAGVVSPLLIALTVITTPASGTHIAGLVVIPIVALLAAAIASSRVRGSEAAADYYARRELGITLTPETAAELAPHECPWPRLARLTKPWATEMSWAKRLAAHGPNTGPNTGSDTDGDTATTGEGPR